MPRNPETALRKKIETLERHRAMPEALIAFLRSHPHVAAESTIYQLHGKVGLNFPDYALIVPTWRGGKLSLRLVKSGEDWFGSMDADDFYRMEKVVIEDVTRIPDAELDEALDRLYQEANPDADEDEEEPQEVGG